MSERHAQPDTATPELSNVAAETEGHAATPKADELAAEVRDTAARQAEFGKDTAADRLEDIADAIHGSAKPLKGQEDWLASLVEGGADSLFAVADSLRSNDLRGTLRRIERMARGQPALLAGVSLVAGFALVRLGRAGLNEVSSPSGAKQG